MDGLELRNHSFEARLTPAGLPIPQESGTTLSKSSFRCRKTVNDPPSGALLAGALRELLR